MLVALRAALRLSKEESDFMKASNASRALLHALTTLVIASCATGSIEGGAAGEGPSAQAVTAQPDPSCQLRQNGGKDYWFCSTTRTWQAAKTLCESVSMQLVRIDSLAEHNWIGSQLSNSAWIGATDGAVEGTWRWVDNNDHFWTGTAFGQPQGGRFTRWAFGEPNNLGNEDCGEFRFLDGMWIDTPCSATRPVICESTPATANAPQAPDTACTRTTRNGKTYWVCSNDRTFDDARSRCQGAGMDMVAIEDQGEADFLRTKITRASHIGLEDRGVEGEWRYTANNALSWCGASGGSTVAHAYANWAAGQPALTNTCKQVLGDGSTYYLCSNELSWSAARAQCASSTGMSLARIDTPLEDSLIASSISWETWIGASDSAQEGEWTWSDGTKFWSGGPAGGPVQGFFENFRNGEPNDQFGTEDCGLFEADTDQWNDEPCDLPHPWICEAADDTGVPDANDCAWVAAGNAKWNAGSCTQLRSYVCESLPATDPVDPELQMCGEPVLWRAPNGDEMPDLEDPIPSQQTWDLSQAFTWGSTSALPVTNPQGHPTLYYAIIYIEEKFQLEAMDAYQIDYEFMPFFREERAKWAGQKGGIPLQGDGRGVFAFAIIPGAIYNALRDFALQNPDELPFRAIILRQSPAPSSTYADGSLHYEYLRSHGYLYRGLGPNDVAPQGLAQKGLLKRLVGAIVELGEEIVDGVRNGIGNLREVFRGEATLKLSFYAENTDWAFQRSLSDTDCQGNIPCSTLMQSGWGANRGKELPIKGVEVRASQGALGWSLNTGKTDNNGHAEFKVTAELDTEICFHLENDAAEFTTFVSEKRICDFGFPEISAGDVAGHNNQYFIRAKHPDINAFAQMTDAREYAKAATGKDMREAVVLVGKIADKIDKAMAPCLDFPNWGFQGLQAGLQGLIIAGGGVVDTVLAGSGLPAFGATGTGVGSGVLLGIDVVSPDIVLPKDRARTRGIPTHEYGHYFMCNLIYDSPGPGSRIEFGRAWTDVITKTIFHAGEADCEACYISEAWADAFTAQVVGGVNYFDLGTPDDEGGEWWNYNPHGQKSWFDASAADRRPAGEPTSSASTIRYATGVHVAGSGSEKPMFYCNPESPVCFDDNIGRGDREPYPQLTPDEELGSSSPMDPQIARVMTLMHDMFDGRGPGDTLIMGNGAVWPPRPQPANAQGYGVVLFDQDSMAKSAYANPGHYALFAHQDDEAVQLPGTIWLDIIAEWSQEGNVFREKEFFKGLSAAMQENGVDDEEICHVFALHSPSGTCPSYLPVAANVTPDKPKLRAELSPDRYSDDARFIWTSDAPFATGFEYVVRNETEGTQISSGTRPFSADEQTLAANNLPYDVEISGRVTVINGSRRGAPAEVRLTTPAEQVTTVTVTVLPARTNVCWDTTIATSYDIEVQEDGGAWNLVSSLDADPNVTTQCRVLYALPAVPHGVRIVAVNRFGEGARPSPEVDFMPIEPTGVFVSFQRGDDAHLEAGSSDHPFETLDAALELVRTRRAANDTDYDAVSLNMGWGPYTMAEPWIESAGKTMLIVGGLDQNSWQQTSVPTRIEAAADDVGSGTAADVDTCFGGNIGHVSSFVVGASAALIASYVEITADTVPGGVVGGQLDFCQSVFGIANGFVRLEHSTIGIHGPSSANGACQMGLTSGLTNDDEDSSLPQDFEIEDSVIAGGTAESAPQGLFVGLCTLTADQIRIERSTVTGVDGPLTSDGNGLFAGLFAIRVDNLTVARSEITSAGRAFDWSAGEGVQHAISVSNVHRTLIHNSILRTGRGSSVALDLTSREGGTIKLFYVTVVAGDDYGLVTTADGDPEGTAVSLGGEPNALVMANSVFANAAGRADDTTAMDLSNLTSPRTEFIRGNAFSVRRFVRNGPRHSFYRCGTSASDFHSTKWQYGDPEAFICDDATELMYDVGDNIDMMDEPCPLHPNPVTCEDNQDFDGKWSYEVAQFDEDGKSTLIGGALRCNGVNLTERSEWRHIRRDFDNDDRDYDEDDENLSIGAYVDVCTADDLEFNLL
jgi:hypothetical protein